MELMETSTDITKNIRELSQQTDEFVQILQSSDNAVEKVLHQYVKSEKKILFVASLATLLAIYHRRLNQ